MLLALKKLTNDQFQNEAFGGGVVNVSIDCWDEAPDWAGSSQAAGQTMKSVVEASSRMVFEDTPSEGDVSSTSGLSSSWAATGDPAGTAQSSAWGATQSADGLMASADNASTAEDVSSWTRLCRTAKPMRPSGVDELWTDKTTSWEEGVAVFPTRGRSAVG